MPATAPFEPDAATRATLDFLAGSTAPLVPPAGTIYLGAYVNYLKNLGPYETQTATFEKQIGRKLALHSEYYAFTDSFPSAEDVDDYRNGRVPVDSWDCGDTDYRVAQGKDDAVITKVAQNFKAYGFPIFLRYFWEMNLPTTALPRTECVDKVRDKNGYFNATDYVAAWQHIHAIFVAQGVKNVVWVWNPSGSLVVSPIPYYPGATETDWIGFDHYDLTGAGLQSTYSAPYNALTPLSKPIMIGETGTTSQYQSADISSAPRSFKRTSRQFWLGPISIRTDTATIGACPLPASRPLKRQVQRSTFRLSINTKRNSANAGKRVSRNLRQRARLKRSCVDHQ